MHTAQPWYRQFWPWFLLALPAAAVIAGVITLGIALRHSDSPVRDDYSKEGLILQRTPQLDSAAAARQAHARLAIDDERITLQLGGHFERTPTRLILQFIHPFDAANDFSVALELRGAEYAGRLPLHAPGRWRVELHDAPAHWRLRGSIELPARQAYLLQP